MRIDMNSIGNYTPANVRNINKQIQPSESSGNETLKKASQVKHDNLTAEEKNFFTKLYPENKSDIVDYHFYERNGKLSGVKIGSLIDRRG